MSDRLAVTFDFHETLASCDRWFDLEVRHLPAAVMSRLPAAAIGRERRPAPEEITATYRTLRGEIAVHGVEMDALSGLRETYRRLGLSVDDGLISPIIDDLMRGSLEDVAPKPGAVETVRALHEDGYALGVVSSAVYHPFLLWVLDAFAILPLFETVVTSASAGFYKSRQEIYQRALDDLRVQPARAVHVGDSARWDHLTARSLGIRTVLVSPTPPDLESNEPPPDLHLTTLVDAAPRIAAAAGSRPGRPPGT